jgi:uncharacterized protein with NAD-binding domain and iron-sulfur cluster
MKQKIYIIGAGISGLAAAYFASKKGFDVTIFESSKQAGGRARSYYDEVLGGVVDNGNHLILGANKNILNLIDELNLRSKFNSFHNAPISFYNFQTGKTKNILSVFDLFSNVKDYLNLPKLFFYKNKTVDKIFEDFSSKVQIFTNQICRTILNTEAKFADAEIFIKTLSKVFLSKNGMDYFYPKISWAEALISPLCNYLLKNNVQIFYNKILKEIKFEDGKISGLIFDDSELDISDEKIILATPEYITKRLLKSPSKKLNHNPIVNVHFKYEKKFPAKIIGVLNGHIDWIFFKENIISTTTSAASGLVEKSSEEIIKLAQTEIEKILFLQEKPISARVVKEKKASFSCEKENLSARLPQKTEYKNLYIVGDHVQNNLPATLEGAVLSAFRCLDASMIR